MGIIQSKTMDPYSKFDTTKLYKIKSKPRLCSSVEANKILGKFIYLEEPYNHGHGGGPGSDYTANFDKGFITQNGWPDIEEYNPNDTLQ